MLVDYLSREQIMNELQESFQPYLNKYGIEAIGIFEEEGPESLLSWIYNSKRWKNPSYPSAF